jgi:cobalt/nickel transport system permease protein
MEKVSGQEELEANGHLYTVFSNLQEKTAILPDYALRESSVQGSNLSSNANTSIAGIVGGFITLLIVVLIGFGINHMKKRTKMNSASIQRE